MKRQTTPRLSITIDLQPGDHRQAPGGHRQAPGGHQQAPGGHRQAPQGPATLVDLPAGALHQNIPAAGQDETVAPPAPDLSPPPVNPPHRPRTMKRITQFLRLWIVDVVGGQVDRLDATTQRDARAQLRAPGTEDNSSTWSTAVVVAGSNAAVMPLHANPPLQEVSPAVAEAATGAPQGGAAADDIAPPEH